jgi:hypothetical protein
VLRALLVAVGALLGACASIPFPEPHVAGPYGLELRAATRRKVLYDGLETRAFVHLVRVTPALAAEQARVLSEARQESEAEAKARRDTMVAAAAQPTYFAVVFTPRAEWNDWESKKTSWRIALDQGEAQVLATKVERFERPFHPDLHLIYPYLDEFHVAYRIQFPEPQGSRPPRFTAAGALGQIELDWGSD